MGILLSWWNAADEGEWRWQVGSNCIGSGWPASAVSRGYTGGDERLHSHPLPGA